LTTDPHFHTWDNIWFDYHGACDLILIANADAGIHLHIRTEPKGGYASISHAVLKLGNEILEITDDQTGTNVLFNTGALAVAPSTLGGYALDVTVTTNGYSTRFEVDMLQGQFIRITRYPHGLDISILANGATFSGSEGLCGSWNSGGLQNPDGDPLESSQEWQVPMGEYLFATPSTTCTPFDPCSSNGGPTDATSGCGDGGGGDAAQLAAAALVQAAGNELCLQSCEDTTLDDFPKLRENCKFDLETTKDIGFLCTPAYNFPNVILPQESLSQRMCQDFAVHARTTITFAGVMSTIHDGDIGVSPGTSITGSKQMIGDGVTIDASVDFAASVKNSHEEAMAYEAEAMPIEIGGKTFIPGTHRSNSAINIAHGTEVTLSGKGTYIFQAGSTLVTAADTKIILTNGARAENVVWVLGSAATLGANSLLEGSILAGTAITFGTQSRVNGCALAQSAVTFESEGSVWLPKRIDKASPEIGGRRRLRG
jgi:hypothetical protein